MPPRALSPAETRRALRICGDLELQLSHMPDDDGLYSGLLESVGDVRRRIERRSQADESDLAMLHGIGLGLPPRKKRDWNEGRLTAVILSTAHIREEDDQVLRQAADDHTCPLTVHPLPYGWLLPLHAGAFPRKPKLPLSREFRNLYRSLLRSGVDLLLLDRDGPVRPDLPVHDW